MITRTAFNVVQFLFAFTIRLTLGKALKHFQLEKVEDYKNIKGIKYVNVGEQNDGDNRVEYEHTIWLYVEEFKCTFHDKSVYHSADGINGGTTKFNGVWNIAENAKLQMSLKFMSYADIDPSLMVDVMSDGRNHIKEFTLNQLMEFENETF